MPPSGADGVRRKLQVAVGLAAAAAAVVIVVVLVVVGGGDSDGGGAGNPLGGTDQAGPSAEGGPSGQSGQGEQNGQNGQGEPAATGWVSAEHGDSQGLVTNGELVCSTTGTGDLYCVDAATGEPRFRQSIGTDVTSPVLAGDTLLVGVARGPDAGLQAYDLNGDRLWRAPAELGSADQLAVVGDVVAVVDGLTGGEAVGFDIATGEERWRAYTEDGASVPTLVGGVLSDGERVYVGMVATDGPEPEAQVAAVDPATGQEMWRASLGPDLALFLAMRNLAVSEDGGTVAVVVWGETTDHLVVLDTATGEVVRQEPLDSSEASVVQVGGTTIVAAGLDLNAYGPDWEGRWTVQAPAFTGDPTVSGPGPLVGEGDRAYLLSDGVFEVDPATGATEPVAEGVTATDVVVVGDLVVVAGSDQLEALPVTR